MATKKKILEGLATVCQGEVVPPPPVEFVAPPALDLQPEPEPETEGVRVYKKINDGMMQFYGEDVRTGTDGRQYFTLTESAREAVSRFPNLIWPE